MRQMCNDIGAWRHETVSHGRAHHGHQGCCCDAAGFATRPEKVEMLEEYRRQLERELAWVGERIEKLKVE